MRERSFRAARAPQNATLLASKASVSMILGVRLLEPRAVSANNLVHGE